jgi:hypothetical protein
VSGQPADRPGLQQRLDALPLPLFFVVFAIVVGLAGAALDAVPDGHVDVSALAVRVLLFSVVFTWLAARRRRRTGGARVGAAVGAASRRGTLPADADPAVWRPALEAQRRTALRSRRLGPAVFGPLAVGAVALAVLLGSPAWGFIAAGAAALVVLGPVGARRGVDRVDALLAQLDDRSA